MLNLFWQNKEYIWGSRQCLFSIDTVNKQSTFWSSIGLYIWYDTQDTWTGNTIYQFVKWEENTIVKLLPQMSWNNKLKEPRFIINFHDLTSRSFNNMLILKINISKCIQILYLPHVVCHLDDVIWFIKTYSKSLIAKCEKNAQVTIQYCAWWWPSTIRC